MQYKIYGGNLPVVSITLNDKEKVYSDAGGMAWMSDNIDMETSTRGGLLKGVGRMFSGESLFLVNFISKGKGEVTFVSEFPGEIKAIKLKKDESIIIQKDSFLCAEDSVKLEMHLMKKLGTGLFGGEGFILAKLQGPGKVILQSMPIRNLANKLIKYMPRPAGGGKGSGINLGNVFEHD